MSTKPLILWAARKHWAVRFSGRTSVEATGIFTTADGPLDFRYERETQRVHLPRETILLNEYGWEVDEKGRTVFRSYAPRAQKSEQAAKSEQKEQTNE